LNKRATIQDVAEKAGVSDAMRRKVEAAMEELSCRLNMAARGPRGSTYTLGILMPVIHNPFYPDILNGIVHARDGTHFQLLSGVRVSADRASRRH
jgi:DNA-binding LacI/PurR family transcriptional regulator